MNTLFSRINLDALGISASMICLVHCLFLPLFLVLFPLAGVAAVENEAYEIGLIALSFGIAFVALRSGYQKHHRKGVFALFFLAMLLFIGGFMGHHDHHGHHHHAHPAHHLHETLLPTVLHISGSVVLAVAHLFNWRWGKNYRSCSV